MNNLTIKTENGLRIYKPVTFIDEDDEAEFEKRKMYILQSERDYKATLDSLADLIRAKNSNFIFF